MSKNKHRQKEDSYKGNSEESGVDFSKIREKTKKIGKTFSWIRKNIFTNTVNIWLLVIILITISVYVRLGPVTLPMTDQWAESTVLGNLQNSIAAEVRVQRPDLPEASVAQITQTEFNNYYMANKDQIDAQIQMLSLQFKDQLQDDKGLTHLLGIDEYTWYSYSKWYELNGYYGTEIVDGNPRFMLRYGRFGQNYYFIFPSYPINVLHNILQIFNPERTVKQTAFYISLVLMALICIPAFFLGRKMFGNIGGFFAAATIAVSSIIVGRTLAGAPESDGYTILFPLIMTWLLFEAISSKNLLKTIILTSLAGLTGALFYFFWGGWWFTLLLLLGTAGIYIIYSAILRKLKKEQLWSKELLRQVLIPVILLLSMIIFAMLIGFAVQKSGVIIAKDIISAPLYPFNFITGFKAAAEGNIIGENYALWPNVLRTVAELNPASINEIIGSPGALSLGKVIIPFFWLGVIGILLLFIRYKEDIKYPFYGAFLALWLISTVYAGTTGVRFIVFVSIVIAFGLGSLVSYIMGPGLNALTKSMDFDKKVIIKWMFIIILFFALLWAPIKGAKAIGDNAAPIFDDAWYNSMKPIEQNPEKSIITSWWDYGHFFQAYTNHTVTFDGGDQGKRIYWVGRTLITPEEDEAVDILKMLNCGQEMSYDLLEQHLKDRMQATNTMLKITRENKDDAKITLMDAGLNEEQTTSVLAFTHCSDLYDMYYVTSEDMVGKATVWGHFGSWDFEKSYFYYYLRNLPLPDAIEHAKNDLGYDTNKTRDLYNQAKKIKNENEAAGWISTYPGYVTQKPVSCLKEPGKNIVTCNYNILLNTQPGVDVILTRGSINLTNPTSSVFLLQAIDQRTGAVIQQNALTPTAIVLGVGDSMERITFNSTNFGYDFVVYETEGSYYSLIANEALAQSLFTKLFFMNGKYTEHFEKVSDATSFRGERIIVWKVNP
ncbi:MAG: STT3 domain-containing protein [Candidatus Nanoarchaeia archaeon]